MITQGQMAFQTRVARINAGQFSRVPEPGVVDESGQRAWIIGKNPLAQAQSGRAGPRSHQPFSLVLAFLVGVLAYALSQFLRFHLMGLPDPGVSPDIAMATDGVSALVVLMGLSVLFATPRWTHALAKLLGLGLAMGLMHNLVHLAPESFEMAFSGPWVHAVTTTTEPLSLLFRGESLTLI